MISKMHLILPNYHHYVHILGERAIQKIPPPQQIHGDRGNKIQFILDIDNF
jgi:hypothetical protein